MIIIFPNQTEGLLQADLFKVLLSECSVYEYFGKFQSLTVKLNVTMARNRESLQNYFLMTQRENCIRPTVCGIADSMGLFELHRYCYYRLPQCRIPEQPG